MKKYGIYFIFMMILTSVIFSQSHMIVPEYRRIDELLTKDLDSLNIQSPMILSNSIIFFYKGKAKSVQLAGDFNNWQGNLFMSESRSNLWTITLTNRIDAGTYKYRLKVDGFWIPDPMNPDFEYDTGRQKLSLLTFKTDFIPNKKFPFWISNNTYLFQVKNTNANNVTIAGDFNDWNPYSHQLTYKGAGIFEIMLELAPKKIYLYSFIEDGKWTIDPNNKKQYRNAQDRPINGFYADQDHSIP